MPKSLIEGVSRPLHVLIFKVANPMTATVSVAKIKTPTKDSTKETPDWKAEWRSMGVLYINFNFDYIHE